jgi:hypothetical protein
MENPYVREGRGRADWAGGHSPNRMPLATRKLWQNDEFPDSFALSECPATAVDKALTRPYLCAVGSVAEALILSIVFGR